MKMAITSELLQDFAAYLMREEKAVGTIEKYMRDIRAFAAWLGENDIKKEAVTGWKDQLLSQHYAPVTVNSMLAALHQFFAFAGWNECRIKYLRIQRQLFRRESRELSRSEFDRLVGAAQDSGKQRLTLLLECMAATGVRVSEVRYFTVEAVQSGIVEVSLKGKIRTVFLPPKLCRKLLKYASKNKIAAGEIFLTKSGRTLSRRQIWAEMKALCKKAGVAPSKVFPHNIRHLFARAFYRISRDVAKLVDVLGHSSIETTRIYLISTGTEHAQQMAQLGFVT